MKGTPLITLCFILSISAPISRCEEDRNVVMVYAVGNEVYSKKLGGFNRPSLLTSFDANVTGLAIHDGYLYATHLRSFLRYSKLWRVKFSPNSESIEIDYNSWQLFDIFTGLYENIYSIKIADGDIFLGTNYLLWRCSTKDLSSCRDFEDGLEESLIFPKLQTRVIYPITEIEHNPIDGKIYTVQSYKGYNFENVYTWIHNLWSCPVNTKRPCIYTVMFSGGWATLHVAFNSFWFANQGCIWKCSLYQTERLISKRLSKLDDYCLMFNDFNQKVNLVMGSAAKYLYVRFEFSNQIWQCHPNIPNLCFEEFELPHEEIIGPYIFV